MPFAVTLGLVALCTVAALVRLRRFGRAGYFLAVVVNEIPQVAAAFLVASTALAWAEGDLRGTTGLILGVGIVATLAGLLELARRGLLAGAVVRDSLGTSGIRLGPARRWRWLRPLFAPFPVRPWRVKRIPGIAYWAHRRQRLDVYRRRQMREPGPVLIYFHGGGYVSGGRHREARALLHLFASRGWVCVSAGYRLRPDAGFAEHLADARAAVAWAHTHASEHGGDAHTVVIAGSSAGAHVSALCALTQQEQPDSATSRIDAAVCLYGYYGRYYGRGPDETPVSTPLQLDPSLAPPFFLAHGDRDSYVPASLARDFARHLRSASAQKVVYAELPYAQHGFDLFRSWRFAAVLDGIEAFLADCRVVGRR